MKPTKELLDQIRRERILRARATPPEQRIIEGLKMTDAAVKFMEAAIRSQFPNFTDSEVSAEMERRYEIARRHKAPG